MQKMDLDEVKRFISSQSEETKIYLGQGMLDKLFKTYQSRDVNDNTLPQKFNDGLEVANYIYQHVGPDFLTWAAKQYNQDQHFFLHDLAEWKNVLDQFRSVLKDKRIQIERDINRYQNIDVLRQVIAQAGGAQQEIGTKFYERVINKLDPFVESGQATWIYRGKDYSIYYPKTWEASRAVASACPHKTSVCVAANKSYYDSYTKGGVLMYTIGQEDVYLDYIKTKPDGQKSEFANSVNDHKYDLNWQLQQFPRLKSVLSKVINDETDTKTKWTFSPPSQEELKKLVAQYGWALDYVPYQLRTPELCKIAVAQNGRALYYVPRKLITPELCKIAVAQSGQALAFVPDELRTPELCKIAVAQNGWALAFVPDELRTPELCKIAVAQDGLALRYVPAELRTPELEKLAVKNQYTQ